MPYLVQGTAQQLAQVFAQEWLTEKSSDGEANIAKDLSRTPFLGSEEQAKKFLATWQATSQKDYYCQGNMFAGNLFLLLDLFLFKQEDEDLEVYQTNFEKQSFAYLNEANELCGLTVFYRKDNPSQWLIACSVGNNLAPQERKVALLSSFELQPYVKKPQQDVDIAVVDRLVNPLMAQLGSPFLKRIVEHSLHADNGAIDVKLLRMKQLIRFLNVANPAQLLTSAVNFSALTAEQLFAENPTLDRVVQHNLELSTAMVMDCLASGDGLRKEVEAIKFTDDEPINECLLRMTVYFYEQNLLDKHRTFLNEQLFSKTLTGTLWNDDQLKLLPFLLKKKYTPELCQLILSEKAYYSAVTILIAHGFTQDVPVHFTKPDKLKELEFINQTIIKESSKETAQQTQELCAIFWVKGELSYDEYQRIIKASATHPLMATTLIALDKSATVSIEELKALALNPQKHLQQSILHHFSSEQLAINKTALNKLNVTELERLSLSFNVLKSAGYTSADLYDQTLKSKGQLLRIFLPRLQEVLPLAHRKALIDLLFLGEQKELVSQGKAVFAIKEPELQKRAIELHEHFSCAKQLQKLGFNDDTIFLAAQPHDEGAYKLRQIIMKVEAQCKEIHERLLSSSANYDKVQQWQKIETQYRQTLYSIAYDAIIKPEVDFRPRFNQMQNKALDIVDPEIKSMMQKALIFIANFFITVLSLGIANEVKYKKTGNYWFFNQTTSGEELRALDQEYSAIITPPAPTS